MKIDYESSSFERQKERFIALAGRFTGPADDFWEEHILGAEQYRIYLNRQEVGFFAMTDEKLLTAFSVDRHLRYSAELFRETLLRYQPVSARVLSCDKEFLNLCLDYQKAIEMQAYMFEYVGGVRPPEWGKELFRIATMEDESSIMDDGAADNIRQGKYFVLEKDGVFMGQGFYNPLLLHKGVTSIGMEVHPDFRMRGVGRSIIMHLTQLCIERGEVPVCGCWWQNSASRLTLESAGFAATTRYINVWFNI